MLSPISYTEFVYLSLMFSVVLSASEGNLDFSFDLSTSGYESGYWQSMELLTETSRSSLLISATEVLSLSLFEKIGLRDKTY